MMRKTTGLLWSGAVGGALVSVLAVSLPGVSGAEAAPSRAPRVVQGPISRLNGVSVAKCPRGTRVLNGGYVSHGFRMTNGALTDYVLRNAPLRDGSGWQAKQIAGRIQAFAVCVLL